MLIEQILSEKQDEVGSLAAYAGHPAYEAEIHRVLGDFQRSRYTADDLLQAVTAAPSTRTASKLTELATLMTLLQQRQQELGLMAADEQSDRVLSLLRQDVPELRFLERTAVWVLGFGLLRSFTTQELDVLTALQQRAASLTVTLCAPPQERSAITRSDISPTDLFYHGNMTRLQLQARFPDLVERVIPSSRTPRAEELFRGIVSGLPFSLSESDRKSPQSGEGKGEEDRGGVTLVMAEQPRLEFGWVASEIRRLIWDENYRCRDIAVAVPKGGSDPYVLRSVFREYGLDAFLDQRRSLLSTPLFRYLEAFLNLAQTSWRTDDVLALLRTGLTSASPVVVDAFENHCLEAGIVQDRQLRDEQRFARSLRDPDVLLMRQQVIMPILEQADQLRRERTAEGKTKQLAAWLFEQSGVRHGLEEQIATLRAGGENDLALDLAIGWNALLDLLHEAQRVLRLGRISIERYRALILAGIEGLQSATIPTGLDRVRVGSIDQMMQYPCRALFVVGTSAGTFPSRTLDEGLLRDRERAWLEDVCAKPIPNRTRDQGSAADLGIALLLANPSEKLYLSVSTTRPEEQADVFRSARALRTKNPRDYTHEILPRQRIAVSGNRWVNDPSPLPRRKRRSMVLFRCFFKHRRLAFRAWSVITNVRTVGLANMCSA